MSLSTAIARTQVIAGALAGIKEAPTNPPESANQFPFAVSYPETGGFTGEAGFVKGLHVIITEIHCALNSLPQAVVQAIPYIESFPAAMLADPTLAGTVNTIVASNTQRITYEFGLLKWGGVDTMGVRFRTTVKIE